MCERKNKLRWMGLVVSQLMLKVAAGKDYATPVTTVARPLLLLAAMLPHPPPVCLLLGVV